MKILMDDIEKVMMEAHYVYKEKYPDHQLNCFYNYWYFLNEHEEELKVTKEITLETILYSKYYWFSRLTDRFHEVIGFDAGIDQQQLMIVEEIEQRLDNVDWSFIVPLMRFQEGRL